ncbi:MAG: hypothetical protein ACI4XN_04510 [Candidatus Kurthia intestinigallinarum]
MIWIKICLLIVLWAMLIGSFITQNFTYMPLITLFVGLFFTLIAYDMYKRKAKRAFFYGIASVVIILFALFSF